MGIQLQQYTNVNLGTFEIKLCKTFFGVTEKF